MATQSSTVITVENTINAPVKKVWEYWTMPEHIIHWNNASDDWHTPYAKNDLQVGGKFTARMEAKDGSFGFDFEGKYDAITPQEYIEYTIGDGRKVKIFFTAEDSSTKVKEIFEAENQNSVEMQRAGWQSILDNFKKYVENY
ncbi:MAG TPA: SRPBCC family protein [Ginsengibacter sp.]|nr:SRPBCC family protein [Ginsengibacter sp.]